MCVNIQRKRTYLNNFRFLYKHLQSTLLNGAKSLFRKKGFSLYIMFSVTVFLFSMCICVFIDNKPPSQRNFDLSFALKTFYVGISLYLLVSFFLIDDVRFFLLVCFTRLETHIKEKFKTVFFYQLKTSNVIGYLGISSIINYGSKWFRCAKK